MNTRKAGATAISNLKDSHTNNNFYEGGSSALFFSAEYHALYAGMCFKRIIIGIPWKYWNFVVVFNCEDFVKALSY